MNRSRTIFATSARSWYAALAAVWLVGLPASFTQVPARADLFLLSNGGQVEGELVNRDESPREKYVIRTAAGGELTLARKQVERQVVRKEAESRYEELLPKMQSTAEDHLKMAEWCQKHGLDAQREFHMQEVLKLDPNNVAARHALGYALRNKKWVTVEDVMRNQGYVRYKNAWRLPQEIEFLNARDKFNQSALEWKRRIKLLRSKVLERGDAKALEELRGIQDPMAGPTLVDLLDDKNEPVSMKLLYIDLLSNIGGNSVIGAFVDRVVKDDDEQVRDRCTAQLAKGSNRIAARLFARHLTSDNPLHINRAGNAIGAMGISDHTQEMISALVTRHTRITGGDGGGGGMGIGFSSNGGLSVGGNRPQKVTLESQNEGVLAGLNALYPGTNFLFDVDRWKEWWAQKNSPRDYQLRRSS
jgi:hypothetical protein